MLAATLADRRDPGLLLVVPALDPRPAPPRLAAGITWARSARAWSPGCSLPAVLYRARAGARAAGRAHHRLAGCRTSLLAPVGLAAALRAGDARVPARRAGAWLAAPLVVAARSAGSSSRAVSFASASRPACSALARRWPPTACLHGAGRACAAAGPGRATTSSTTPPCSCCWRTGWRSHGTTGRSGRRSRRRTRPPRESCGSTSRPAIRSARTGARGRLQRSSRRRSRPSTSRSSPLLAALASALAGGARAPQRAAPGRRGAGRVAGAGRRTSSTIYALQGNVKEIAMLACLAAAAAFGRERCPQRASGRPAPPASASAGAAMVSVFSAAAVPYVGVVRGDAARAARSWSALDAARRASCPRRSSRSGSRRSRRSPRSPRSSTFGDVAKSVFAKPSAQADLGHLLRPLELVQAAGVWLSADYRIPVPPERHTLNAVLIALVLALR